MKITKSGSQQKIPGDCDAVDIYKTSTGLTVFISEDLSHAGPIRHLSASHPNRLPNYWEMKELRYRLCGDVRYMAMIFPPEEEFVNLHPNCLHLYELTGKDAAN